MPPLKLLEEFATLSIEDRQALSIEQRTSIITSLNEELAVANEEIRLRTALATHFPGCCDFITVTACNENVYNKLPVVSVFDRNVGMIAKKSYLIQRADGQEWALHISYKQWSIEGSYMRGCQYEAWTQIDIEYLGESHLWCYSAGNPGGGATNVDHGCTKAVFEEVLKDLQSSLSGGVQQNMTTLNEKEVTTEEEKRAVEDAEYERLSNFLDVWLPKNVLDEKYYVAKYIEDLTVREIIMQEMIKEEED